MLWPKLYTERDTHTHRDTDTSANLRDTFCASLLPPCGVKCLLVKYSKQSLRLRLSAFGLSLWSVWSVLNDLHKFSNDQMPLTAPCIDRSKRWPNRNPHTDTHTTNRVRSSVFILTGKIYNYITLQRQPDLTATTMRALEVMKLARPNVTPEPLAECH